MNWTDPEYRAGDDDSLRKSELTFRLVIDGIAGLVAIMTAEGEVEFVNNQVLEYFGRTLEELKGWQVSDAVHPDDLPHAVAAWRHSVETGDPYDVDHRLRRADGTYRWFHSRGQSLRDAKGHIVRWYNLLTDIEDRKRVEEALRASEQNLRMVIDSIPGHIMTFTAEGEVELINRQTLIFFGKTLEESKNWIIPNAVYSDDLPRLLAARASATETGKPYELEFRARRADGVYRWFHSRALPLLDSEGRIVRWYKLYTDIEERKKADEKLRRSEAYLSEAQKLSHTGSFGWDVSSGEVYWSHETFRIFEYEPTTRITIEVVLQRTHPEDRPALERLIERVSNERTEFDFEHRLLMPDGSLKHLRVVGYPAESESGALEFVGAVTDVTGRKKLERELEDERDRLRLLLDLNNRVAANLNLRQLFRAISSELRRVFKCDFVGMALPDSEGKQLRQHMVDFPGSKGLMKEGAPYPMEGSLSGLAFRSAKRVALNSRSEASAICNFDPAFHQRVNEEGPFQSGCFLPLISSDRVLGVLQLTSREERAFSRQDVEFLDQVANQIAITLKNALEYEQVAETRDRLQDENVALREEIDQAFMFEEIVGSSPALRSVLSSVVKVAPTDSTVLISGETGTGKELIARAIHRRSQRSDRALISVNCAAIPPSLIASELFGHEKGAFTGAVQQRRGRFELAHSGTIFLDEIGEIPTETQVALLRVLQERQLERVGGSRSVPVDVRVIAATNRDLSTAISAGTFRSDLFYRLNVFPIQMPSLRQRQEDIPLLVEYFVKRFAEKMAKHIIRIDTRTLQLCEAYSWPGNIRELQNIVERSVILCTGDTFSIDEAWLSIQDPAQPDAPAKMTRILQDQEKEIIESALTETRGKVAGAGGAASKLGVPPSTLDSKIKQLGINKGKFKTAF